jgi:F-type H+-transporting ATPase subunit k
MVVMYSIAGRQIGSHWLAMATLGTMAVVTTMSIGGGAAKKNQGPPINAQSLDEENFIKEFMKNAEADEKKVSHGNNADATKKDTGR